MEVSISIGLHHSKAAGRRCSDSRRLWQKRCQPDRRSLARTAVCRRSALLRYIRRSKACAKRPQTGSQRGHKLDFMGTTITRIESCIAQPRRQMLQRFEIVQATQNERRVTARTSRMRLTPARPRRKHVCFAEVSTSQRNQFSRHMHWPSLHLSLQTYTQTILTTTLTQSEFPR